MPKWMPFLLPILQHPIYLAHHFNRLAQRHDHLFVVLELSIGELLAFAVLL